MPKTIDLFESIMDVYNSKVQLIAEFNAATSPEELNALATKILDLHELETFLIDLHNTVVIRNRTPIPV